ncbi:aldo/keto reductase [Salinisphaera hydrothermalis]|uniref:2,5-didehydrogluconate reductase n=1 Tax=Salinisphaera hydrothermalis (strain C41B8) TaxID=1304275 RepID=A0A084INT1_SALHC|nr:aldo/keto reductase [Salinisphaera hydrothermalis]KEZ78365.1 2,5-didehydrogluconate reductase [Salinisphaera hydrothermalis C41B8]
MHNVTANGATIPAIGFGTFELEPKDAEAMVEHALKVGYRHIDTAQAYKNEDAVGRGIKNSGVAREDIFLTTKVWTDRFTDGELQKSVAESLERLDTDYLDLLLLHWPNPDVSLKETLAALNEVQDRGLVRNIGISNFTSTQIHEAAELSGKPLATNQVEYHPYLDQKPVLDALSEHGIALTAYCPLARGEVFKDPTLERIGKKHGKNAGQVALRWLIQQDNVIAVPRSSTPDHVASNFEVFDFELTEEEMSEISKLHSEDGRMINPSFAPAWDNAA